jgi:hypothetical protein
MFQECHICHPKEARLTAELKELKAKESMPNTCKTMDFSRLVEMANKVMAEMRMILTLGDCQASMLKLNELKLVISTSGSISLSVMPEIRGGYPSSPTEEIDVSGWLFSVPQTS